MSSCSGSVCLLVLMGIAFSFGCPVRHIEFPENAKRIHNSIADKLELRMMDPGSRLFSSVIKTINTSCQVKEEVQVMNVTLDVYARIFSSILHDRTGLLSQLTAGGGFDVSNLTAMQDMMEKLKKKLNNMNHHREDVISKLNKINVDDLENQRKALAEFKEIYQAAVIVTHRCTAAHSSAE